MNHEQNMLPINLDNDKYRPLQHCEYWTRECCRAYIRCELKGKPHENAACVFQMWTILQMEMNSDFKKNE